MRVAFHAPLKPPTHPTPSGDRLMARLLMEAARRAGHEVVLASRLRTWDGAGDERRQLRIRDLGARLAAHIIARYRRLPPGTRPGVWLTYHAYHKAPDWLGPAVASALDIPYVIVEPSLSPRQAQGPWRIGYDATLAAIAQADALLTMSAKDRASLEPFVAHAERLATFPPFIDARPFSTARTCRAAHRRDLASRWTLETARPWLAVAAMMRSGDKLQSYQALARILGRLRDLDWILLVAGDGPARAEVEEAFARVPRDRVRYLGTLGQTALAGLYAAADLYLWPAIREAYGMALIEAQAAGCPVVAGRYGGVPDIVDDGRTGIVTAAGDETAFGEAVRRLLLDPTMRARLGQAAAEHVALRHDLDQATATLDRVLRHVAAR